MIVETTTKSRTPLLAALTVLLVASNLRAAITSVGPVVDRISDGTGLSSTALGLLGAVPLLTFAVVSPSVHRLSRRFGPDRTVFGALVVLVAGTLIRSLPGPLVSLWLGTVLLGGAIAVGNVLLPAIVKRVTLNVALLTSLYTSVMGGVAALASGVSVSLAGIGGWRLSLGVWAVLGVPALVLWLPRIRSTPPAEAGRSTPPAEAAPPAEALGSVWRSGVAWSVALYMAAQSTSFYLMITWLPSIEADVGVSAATAGWHLFIFQVIGIVAGLIAGPVIRARADQRAIGATTGVTMLAAVAGLWLAPGAMLLWVTLVGISCGMSIVVALSFFGLRTRTAAATARLSGMAQGVGYLIAAGGPFGAGALHQATGGWTAALVAELVVAAAQIVLGYLAGRDRLID